MQYRKFEALGIECSLFGIGSMRLPLLKNADGSTDSEKIDEPEAVRIIRYGIDHGVNYIDTAYGYHGGNSERLLGKALADGYRKRIRLATKLPVWLVKTYEDFDRLLEEQLTRLNTDYIDFYLLHALHRESWEKVRDMGILDWLDRKVSSGQIRYPGFSFHDQLPVFKEIIDSYDWKMCQIQLNILDETLQAGVEGLRYAGSKGIPAVIMEPLRGGKLAAASPDILDLWNQAEEKRSPVEWAFRWLYNFPEVSVILSGISTMEQLKDNLRIFEHAQPGCMSSRELDLVKRVKAQYDSKVKVGCTACEYCLPCPNGVSIPVIFGIWNDSSIFGMREEYQNRYRKLITEEKGASSCVACGICEAACPQHIQVIEKLKQADAALRCDP
ncbi:MAG TPA: aldo/keto reductase [Clostridiales bacterium]|jgi:predicted aldo/keto reductase-like oxidoreductase|nr:aldo/keto reductase [Clostridiales bacterium]